MSLYFTNEWRLLDEREYLVFKIPFSWSNLFNADGQTLGSMMCNTVNLSDCNIRLSNRTKHEFTPQRVKKVKEGSIGKEIRGRETMRERKKRCSVSRGSKKNWSANEGHLRSWMRPIWKWINQQKNKYRKAKKSMKSPDFVNPGIFVYEAMIEEYICIENRKPKFGADSANFLFFLVL